VSAERDTQQLALFMQARDAKQFGATIDGQLTPSWDDVGPVAQEEYLRDAGAILAAVVALGYEAPASSEPVHTSIGRFTRADCRCEIGVDHRYGALPAKGDDRG
jgi:hypothetical protein